jgi:hypothetical protein
MADQYSILAQLPSMSWRGIVLPVIDRSHTFQFETAPHKIIYRDGVATEMLGEQGRVFHYSIPMRETVKSAKEGLRQLFSKGFRELYRAYRDPSPGMLVDPAHGAILCTPASWEDRLHWDQTDGADVRLVFTEYSPPGKTVQDDPPTVKGLFDSAQELDIVVQSVPWPPQVQSPEPTTDPFSAAAGILNQLNSNRRRLNAVIYAVEARMAKVERAAEEAQKNAPDSRSAAIFNLIRLQARKGRIDAKRLGDAPPRDKAGTAIRVVLDQPKTVTQLAAECKMTMKEFLYLNPGLSRYAFIPINTEYQRKRPSGN